jgi:arginine deiminase
MDTSLGIDVRSEIGALEGVILHRPGPEVENMTPKNAERALYSDILNLAVAEQEYNQLDGVLSKLTKTFYVKDLLAKVLENDKVKSSLISKICKHEIEGDINSMFDKLMALQPEMLSKSLIEGVELKRDNLTRFLSKERYSLRPLHNFFYMRDASISFHDRVIIGRMANKVREREAMIMESIFDFHPGLITQTIGSSTGSPDSQVKYEGGDILIARDDIMLIGEGPRTSSQGVDLILENIKARNGNMHLIIQELPYKPESFIHLDMAFTFLDRDKCMIFEPLILNSSRFLTIHITVENGEVVNIREEKNILSALKKLGMDLEPVVCGGTKDLYIQEREQWHSGTNFFAVAPGKVIGYGRNVHTIEELNKHGFSVLPATEILSGKINPEDYNDNKYVITIDGSELSRGGGGVRCMTMPIHRKAVDW